PRPDWQAPVVRHDRVISVTAPALGAMILEVPLGARVTEGQRLARILAEPGKAAGEIAVLSPADGLLIIPASARMVRPGDAIATIVADRPAPGSATGRTVSN